MNDNYVKAKLELAEKQLKDEILFEYERREVNGRTLITYFSNIFVKNCKKGKVWKSPEFIITFKKP